MNKSLIAFFLFLSPVLFGQTITNQDRLGTGQFFQPNSANFLSDGSILYLSSTADSLPSGDKMVTGFGENDGWVVKMNYYHQVDWQICLGGSADEYLYNAEELPNGNIILAASSESQISGTKTSPLYGESDIWIIMIDSQGNKIWESSFGGNDSEYPTDILYHNNHIYVLGTSRSGATGNKTSVNFGEEDLWLLKLDMTGQVIWQKTLGGNLTDYSGYITIHNNKILISSTSFSSPSGNKTSVNYSENDCWLIKLDTNGNILNQKTIGGDSFDIGGAITVINDKIVLLYESYSGISGNKTTLSFGNGDGQLMMLDTNLTIESQWSFGGTGSELLIDFNFYQNELFIIASSNSEISGNKTVEPNSDGSSSNFNWDLWFIAFDTLTEQFIYQSSIGGNQNEVPAFVNIDDPNSIRIVTISSSENSGDKTIPLTSHNTQQPYFEFWTFDYTYTLDLEEENTNHALSIYPNPFTSKINLTKAFANQEISFYTTQGRLVLKTKSDEQGVVETSQLDEGFYILKLIDDSGKLYTTRVVKQ